MSSKFSGQQFIGMVSQFFVLIALSLALGWRFDSWMHFKSPWLIWILPLIMIVGLLIKLIIETTKKR
jgi:membrane protein DedA with SNARE-associated domain